MNRYIISILALVVWAGCNKEINTNIGSSDNVINFSSSTNAVTRTIQSEQDGELIDMWESSDRIGITTSGFSTDYNNVEYKALTTVSAETTYFNSVDSDSAISYPESESGDVVFYAYYPYTALYEGDIITHSIENQLGDIGSVDFMTAAFETSYSYDSENSDVSLKFNHQLTKLILNITINNEVSDFTDLAVTARNVITTATYDLIGNQDGLSLDDVADVELTTVVASNKRSAVVTAILHPYDYSLTDLMFEFNIDGKVYGISYGETLTANTIKTNGVTIGREFVEFDDSECTIIPWDGVDFSDVSYEKEVWDGESVAETFDGVAYGALDIYYITNGEELALLAKLVNEGDDLEGKTFYMLNNIDLGDHEWMQIGNGYYYFNGTFDGGGYTIKRLSIDGTDWGAGLFRYTNEDAIIQNLNVEGNLYVRANCGGIVGENWGGTIDNCSFDGSVTTSNYGTGNAGGIVGCNNCGVITNCYNMGTIKGESEDGTDCIGGIAGSTRGAWNKDDEYTGKITACYNLGSVSSVVGDQVGGVVGSTYQGATIESCFNRGSVSGRVQVGGVVGYNVDSHVLNVYNMGEVESTYEYSQCIGGVIGELKNVNYSGDNYDYLDATCKYAYNTGNVKGKYDIAGVIGSNNRIANYCYAEELYPGDKTSCGYYDSGTSSYIVVNSSGDAEYSDNIESLDSDDMASGILLNNLGSEFTSDTQNINGGYPILKAINY